MPQPRSADRVEFVLRQLRGWNFSCIIFRCLPERDPETGQMPAPAPDSHQREEFFDAQDDQGPDGRCPRHGHRADGAGRGQDLLLDLARLAGRSGLDLLPRTAPSQWAEDTGNTVNTSFHSGDVPSQQEAVRAAIAAGADGIVTTSPDPGSLVEVASEAQRRRHPDHQHQHARPDRRLRRLCRRRSASSIGADWAQYLVDKGLVKEGDFVWMPVEVPGATYGVQEEEGIAERLRAARHHLGSDRRHARPGRDHHPHVRLPHRQPRQDQRDHRARRPRHRLDQARLRPGRRRSRAKSRSSAGATRSTPRRRC